MKVLCFRSPCSAPQPRDKGGQDKAPTALVVHLYPQAGPWQQLLRCYFPPSNATEPEGQGLEMPSSAERMGAGTHGLKLLPSKKAGQGRLIPAQLSQDCSE